MPVAANVEVLPKILVVEDDDAIRALLLAALERESLVVDTACNGQQALELCETCEYAVILLDLLMPVLNGFDFLDAFDRKTPRLRSVIFAVTAFDERVAGKLTSPCVHAIVRKPFDIQLLATMVREVALTWAGHLQPGVSPPPDHCSFHQNNI